MSAYNGSLMLIKIGDGESIESFTTLAGMKLTRMVLNNETLSNVTRASGSWRSILGNAGVQSLTINGTGIFTDQASEETARGCAFANTIRNYQVTFGNGDLIQGPFQLANYEREGNYGEEEIYAMTLESAGALTFTPG